MENKNSAVAKFSKQAGNQQSSAVYLALYNLYIAAYSDSGYSNWSLIATNKFGIVSNQEIFLKKWQSN